MTTWKKFARVLLPVTAAALFCALWGLFPARAAEIPEEAVYQDAYAFLEETDLGAYAFEEDVYLEDAYLYEDYAGDFGQSVWYPVAPEDLVDGDIAAITVETEEGVWALGPELEAADIWLDGGALTSWWDIGWNLTWEDGRLTLSPSCSEMRLNISKKRELTLDFRSGSQWELDQGGLRHCKTGLWLCLEEGCFLAAELSAAPPGQTLSFWTPYPPEEPWDPDVPDDPQETPEIIFPEALAWTPYFGQLHAHTSLSDGRGTAWDAYQAAREAGLDFYAVTDHSSSFDGGGSLGQDASGLSACWAQGKEAARAATDETFAALFGFEMTWPDISCLGHILTFATEGFQTAYQPGFSGLEGYYDALAACPDSIGIFAHPGLNFGTFENFSYQNAARDAAMALIEVTGEGGFSAYEEYTRALDAGWRLAPAGGEDTHDGAWVSTARRTVLLAEALTEEGLYEAIRARRAYATEDADLRIFYALNGAPLGSILPAGGAAEAEVWLEDPTDPIGLVEIIGPGGAVAASEEIGETGAALGFSLPGDRAYYYLRVTQPDGDVAVTAPVWLDALEDMGIGALRVESQGLAGESAQVTLTVFNDEAFPLELASAAVCANGEEIFYETSPGTVAGLERVEFQASHLPGEPGLTNYTAQVRGYVNGEARSWEASCEIWYDAPDITAALGVWGLEEEALSNLSALAREAGYTLRPLTDRPADWDLLLLGPEAPSPDQTARLRAFLEDGGSLVLCGGPEAGNDLLSELEVTLRFTGELWEGGASAFSGEAAAFANLSEDQDYFCPSGWGLDPGRGRWLVRAGNTGPVLLAWEDTPWGGRVTAAGSVFFSDGNMPLPAGPSLPKTANQSILEALLKRDMDVVLPLSDIAAARQAAPGELLRVQGYVTAGTSDPCCAFSDRVYLQDGTGGIALTEIPLEMVETGTPLEALGLSEIQDGEPVLRIIRCQPREGAMYRFVPEELPCREAMDTGLYGGCLVQAEGEVQSVVLTADGRGVRRFTLRDGSGLAVFEVEDAIRSTASGRNELASVIRPGQNIRAAGILAMEGTIPVLKVRDCQEAVEVPLPPPETAPQETFSQSEKIVWVDPEYVPPEKTLWPWQRTPDPSNPKTGDGFGLLEWWK